MAMFDPNDLIPIDNSQYELKNWTDVKPEDVPDYVKQAIARGNYPSLGLTPELLKNVQYGTWDLNGQKNYGFKINPNDRVEYTGDNGYKGYMDKAGNILGSSDYNTFGVPLPWTDDAWAHASRSDYLRPAFAGQTTTNTPDGALAYDTVNGAVTPSAAMLDYAQRAKKAADIAGKVSPLAYLAPLFPLAIGLGAGALGGVGIGGAGAGAAEGAAATTGGLGLGGGAIEGSSPLWALSATNAPVAGETVGAIGGGAGLGSAPLTAGEVAGAVGGAGGLGTTAAAPAASTGILGGINSAISGGIESALTSAGLSQSTASAIAPIASKAVMGAVSSGLISGVTGSDPLKGALTGALTGGALGAFGGVDGALASALDIAPKYADMLIGGATGGLGALATKQNPLIGALGGVAAGYANDAMGNTSGNDAASGAGAVTKGGINGTALALGALAAGASALGNKKATTTTPVSNIPAGSTPGPSAVANTLGPTFNMPLQTVASVPVRTALNPFSNGVPNYWAYGGPEQNYFSSNGLKYFGYADGGPIDGGYPTDDGREFSTAHGDTHVRGPGTGTSDSIAARLSDGEFVLRARDVTAAGGGDNDRGAAKLDRLMRSGALSRMVRDA